MLVLKGRERAVGHAGMTGCTNEAVVVVGGGVGSEHRRCCTVALKSGKQEASKTPVLLL